jgi:hypothetical protein
VRGAAFAFVLVAAAAHATAPLSAQAPPAVGRILGTVTDAGTGRPVDGVRIRVTDMAGPAAVTDSRGRFFIVGVPRGIREIAIEHVAYGRGTYLLNVPAGETITLDAVLKPGAVRLDSLIITARARATSLEYVGFHMRARRGVGHFFSGDEISSHIIREALYTVPRLELIQMGTSTRRIMVRGRDGYCVPEIYLDGTRQAWADGDIEEVVGGIDIEAMEVYRGYATPAEFWRTPRHVPCGAIVVWSRR